MSTQHRWPSASPPPFRAASACRFQSSPIMRRAPKSGTPTAAATSTSAAASRSSTSAIAIRTCMAAVQAQLDAFTHTCFGVTPYEPYIKLAERMNQLAPIAAPTKKIDLSDDRRRGGRERRQDCASRDRPLGDHFVHRRISRPHADGAGADRQNKSIQSRLRAVSRRYVPRAVSRRVSRRQHREEPRRDRVAVQVVGRAVARRRDHHRAGARGGRLQRRAVRVPARAARAVRSPRHRLHRRRDPDRLRTHRPDVRRRARRRRARPHHDRQEPRPADSRCRA